MLMQVHVFKGTGRVFGFTKDAAAANRIVLASR
jgi:hypothetical protein